MSPHTQSRVRDIVERFKNGASVSQTIKELSFIVEHLNSVYESVSFCKELIGFISNNPSGSLLMLSLPGAIQAELLFFYMEEIPGVDSRAYLKATPRQVVRRLSYDNKDKLIDNQLIANYNFSLFKKDDWSFYFSKCSVIIPAAKAFFSRDPSSGGFSDVEIANLLLQNPQLVGMVSVERISPNTAIALLISRRADTLWKTYNFARLNKNHWRELLLHANPEVLPTEIRSFIENKDGGGFSDDELLVMAQKCHALINFLNPDKVPFKIAFELYLTGKADILWARYPFASLDRSEWRKILENPSVKIPSFFQVVVKDNRFKNEELCEFALRNDQIHPFLMDLDVPQTLIIKVLLGAKADYIWEKYKFSNFALVDWEHLILGMKPGEILRPRAMAALKECKEITEAFTTKILRWDVSYAPNLPIKTISPDVAIEILLKKKGHFLWATYDFGRLNDDQWLRLLAGTTEPISQAGISFLMLRAGLVDKVRLEEVLCRRTELVKYVDAKYVSPRVATMLLTRKENCELWERYDFSRFDREQLMAIVKAIRINKQWPQTFVECFSAQGKPFEFGDLLEVAITKPDIVVSLVSIEWLTKVDDGLFAQWINVAVRKIEGVNAIRRRLESSENSWNILSRAKLKSILLAAPTLRSCVEWKKWPYKDIAQLAKHTPLYEREVPNPIYYFIWKHLKLFFVFSGITIAFIASFYLQNCWLEQVSKERCRWNEIVRIAAEYERDDAFDKLDNYIKQLSDEDRALLSKDVIFANSCDNLELWRIKQKEYRSALDEIARLIERGFVEDDYDQVKTLLKKIDKGCLPDKRSATESDICEKGRKFVKECEDKKLKFNIAIVSNRVEEVVAELQKVGASKKTSIFSAMLDDIKLLPGFHEYCQLNLSRYTDVRVAVSTLSGQMRDAEVKKISAEELRRKYETEFLFKEDLVKCTDLISICESQISLIKKGVPILDLIDAYESTIKTVKGIIQRDSEVRQLIAQLNGVKNYKDYLNVREKILSEYGSYNELSDFRNLRVPSEFEALKSYTETTESHYGGENYVRTESTIQYNFVGVIKLIPGEKDNAYVIVRNGNIPEEVDFYGLIEKYDPELNAMQPKPIMLIKQNGKGKYYKVNNIDYREYQGAPLFVRFKH